MAQAVESFCGIAATQEICLARGSARQFAVKREDSAPTLRRVRHSRYHRQLRGGKLRNAPKRLIERVTFAGRYANLSEFSEKRRQVIVALLCRIEKRLREPIPFVEHWHELGDLQFPANSFLHRS